MVPDFEDMMTTTYDENERSVSQSRPVDLYVITTPTKTYRLTSYAVDVSYAGNTYTATTMSRGNHQIAQDLTGRELIVYLPISHELVQRFCATGVPEHAVTVVYSRLQQVSGVAIQQASGYATGLSIDGNVALIRVPSLTDDAMKIQLPVVSARKICNHVLFDPRCSPNPGSDGPSPAAFTVAATVISQTAGVGSVSLVVSSVSGNPDGWFNFGRVIHAASGQTVYIVKQVGTTLTLNTQIVGATSSDALTIIAGCDHTIATCKVKFSNRVNNGGMPFMNNEINPWLPNGFGSIQS
jgi:uncharacterized phage protein (TIGR02218 family)